MYKKIIYNIIRDNQNIDIINKHGDILIHDIIRSLYLSNDNKYIIETIKSLLIFSPDLNNKNNINGNTTLHYILKLIEYEIKKDIDIIPFFHLLLDLIKLGGNLNIENIFKETPNDILNKILSSTDKNGNTLLFQLVLKKEYDIVMFFINNGTNINTKDSCLNTILYYAIQNVMNDYDNIKHFYFIQFLLKHNINQNLPNLNQIMDILCLM